MRRWLPIPLASLALLAGCGSSDEGTTTRGATAGASSATASAKVVARTFLGAGKSGHGEAACSLMTAEAVADLARYVRSTGSGGGNRDADCAKYFEAFQTNAGGALPNAEIGRVAESGKIARATVECQGCRRSFDPLLLRNTPSGWRVDFDYRRGY
jgi:hypothetical protein